MSAPTRRGLLGSAAALATVPAALDAAQPHPDAELIRLCAEHIDNLAACNASLLDSDDCPLWLAYDRSRDALCGTKAMTIEGMRPKARTAKAEAAVPGGGEAPDGTAAMNLAWDLVNDILAGIEA